MEALDTTRLEVLGDMTPREVYALRDQREEELYLVGGAIRDALLGRPVEDIDFIVFGDALGWATALAERISGRYVLLDPLHAVGRVVLPGLTLDFARAGAEALEDELRRHDFTINAMAMPLRARDRRAVELVDPLGGLEDLAERRLVLAGPSSFTDDPIRILRAYRFCAEIGMELDPRTSAAARGAVRLLATVAPERIRYELWRIMAMPGSASIVAALDRVGALLVIFPECAEMQGAEQIGLAKIDIWRHALATYREVENLIDDPARTALSPVASEARAYLEIPGNRETLKLAALLHDVAKPQTKTYDEEGFTHFHGHDRLGGKVVQEIARQRLRLSAREGAALELLVERHMHPHLLGREESPTERAMRRFLRAAGDHWVGLILLAYADALASGPEEKGGTGDAVARLASKLAAQRRADAALEREPRLVSGHDLMRELGLRPGPAVGALLRQVEELRLEGKVRSRKEALDAARRLMGGRRGVGARLPDEGPSAQEVGEEQAEEKGHGDAR
jgi:poly(A) polymerase